MLGDTAGPQRIMCLQQKYLERKQILISNRQQNNTHAKWRRSQVTWGPLGYVPMFNTFTVIMFMKETHPLT